MLGQCYLETYDLEMRRQSNKIGQLILIFNNKDTRTTTVVGVLSYC